MLLLLLLLFSASRLLAERMRERQGRAVQVMGSRLLQGGAVRLRDDDVGVVEEGSGAEVVVVDGLGVGLQVVLHVLRVEGEVGAHHGRGQRGGRCVGQVGGGGHGQGRGQGWGQKTPRARQRGDREWRERLGVNPGCRSGQPGWIRGPTVDPEERIMRQAWRKQTPESPLRPHAALVGPHRLLQLRVGGGAVAAVAHGATSHAAGHAAEHARAAQLLTGREDLGGRGGRETEVGSCSRHWRGTLRNSSTCERKKR